MIRVLLAIAALGGAFIAGMVVQYRWPLEPNWRD